MAEQQRSEDEFSFVEAEHEVLDLWEEQETFARSLNQTRNGQPYIFYDGPPFATGLPHHGHLLCSVIKDVVPRYFTMKGFHVQRRFGWDCHGLPIEHEIDKKLGMSALEAVEQMGVAAYNNECRSIVLTYTWEWRKTITRLGRWVDFDDDYKTMEPWYMESVWWVVRQLWDKDLVYRGEKVVPFSTALGTVLSNFEATSNYQDVQDPAVTVLFKLEDEDTYLAAWTTTPWTLPSNLALCVGDDIEYVKVRDADGREIVVAEARLPEIEKHRTVEVVSRMAGRDLVGRRYEPLFDYFTDQKDNGAFVVLSDDYVSTDSGTGIVHQAPAFGEDDFRILKAAGISTTVCPVDMAGAFTDEVTNFAGMHVKDADKHIISHLKDTGALYVQDVIVHSYPFCPRSDTPIIYRTIDSWYVRVEPMREALASVNQQINWVPGHIQAGRMGNWLEGAIDWAISRNRYWGTPLPIWTNDETGTMHCIGSRDELKALTGVMVEDLHREHVDDLTFTREGEPGTYRRIPEVLDCWFESGSMPYAQLHYPFENQEVFNKGFPAEFISEALDQTRGWFYTLIVLGSALYDKPAFKNVIVAGLVMAEDGKKMSKSLRNYTPPDDLMETYGADALRLYLINSGLVRGEEQRFSDTGVKDMVRRVQLPWLNAFRFLSTYAEIDGWQFPADGAVRSDNIMDQWILSRLQSLKARIAVEMEGYRLYNVVPALFDFIEDLTNWYIRLNRARFWASGIGTDKEAAYATLYRALSDLTLAMAPFAPFLAEHLYQKLLGLAASPGADSVHLCDYPTADEALIQPLLEEAVTRLSHIILLGRQRRNQVKVKTKVPLPALTIVHRDEALLAEIGRLEDYVRTELNVKTVRYATDESNYISLSAKPNSPVLGKRLGKRFKNFKAAIEALGSDAIERFQETGTLELDGEQFGEGDILIFRDPIEGTSTVSNRFIAVDMDCNVTPELQREGLAREVINRIQRSRRDIGLEVVDRVDIRYAADAALAEAIAAHRDHIMAETLALTLENAEPEAAALQFDVEGESLALTISRRPT